MKNSCIFCSIINKEIPSEIVYEDEQLLFFKDISPQAPVHLVCIPKVHIETLNDIDKMEAGLLSSMFLKIKDVAKQLNISEDGYRVVINCNKGAGQEVFHVHFHVLGGRELTWPPG